MGNDFCRTGFADDCSGSGIVLWRNGTKKKCIGYHDAQLCRCCSGECAVDDTENLYIEGDNLEVLKLLQETYLGKVKMIYIDPPYNTGNDFVYEDDFAQSSSEYLENSGQFDDEGNRLIKNMETNGRFHTDWLNMIYPRLKLARYLLTDDGVILISIDDNEVDNLKKICDEVFGSRNFVAIIAREAIRGGSQSADIRHVN
ncbi:Adenine specific DNA methylase Mod, partial [Snodgrassella alvi SCGC AB-598-J21]